MPIVFRPQDHEPHHCAPPLSDDYDSNAYPWDLSLERAATIGTVWECPTCGWTWVVYGSRGGWTSTTQWTPETSGQRRKRRRLARRPKGWISR